MPRFVILEHDFPERHWDFMLEAGGALRTWKLEAPPQAGLEIAATASFDHRLVYLDYEGPVSGNRGQVTAWDRGTYDEQPDSRADCATIHLNGQKLRGTVSLEKNPSGAWVWYLTEPPDSLKPRSQ
jgi:hypothetical protein